MRGSNESGCRASLACRLPLGVACLFYRLIRRWRHAALGGRVVGKFYKAMGASLWLAVACCTASPTLSADSQTDAQGCIFFRTGYGAEVMWSPLRSADDTPVCTPDPTAALNDIAPPQPRVLPRPTDIALPACAGFDVPHPTQTTDDPGWALETMAPDQVTLLPSCDSADACATHPPQPLADGRLITLCRAATTNSPATYCVTGQAQGDAHPPYLVQIGIFSLTKNLEMAQTRLRQLNLPQRQGQITAADGRVLFLALAGPVAGRTAAETLQGQMQALGYSDAFLRRCILHPQAKTAN